ncbi:MAG TPA: sugar phosphate isomerase/epimerase family protein [Bacillota bacterium]|nr:sugar phosphate isomerase/epimerase family protein [Bacillota bacterium]
MNIGVVCLSLSCMDFVDVLDFVGSIGGEAIELCTVKGAHNGTLNLDGPDRSSLVRAVEDRGLHIASVAGYNDFASSEPGDLPKELERLEYYCRLAADLGVGIVRAMGGNMQLSLSAEQMISNITRGFRVAVGIAKQYGVTLALENHGVVVNDGPTLMRIVEEVGSDNLGLTLDTGNFCWAGHSLDEAHRYFEQLAPYVVSVHLKDLVTAEGSKTQFVALGDGRVDLRYVVDLLADRGYQGALLCEYEGMGDPKELLKSGVFEQERYVRGLKAGTERSLAYLRSLTLN